MSYWVVVTARNSERTIDAAIGSLLKQTVRPSFICVIDDGSTDGTAKHLEKIKDIAELPMQVITFPDRGYDIRRVVNNWNHACAFVESTKKKFDFMLVATDDTIFPPHYVERLIGEMKKDDKLAVCSGSRGIKSSTEVASLPDGAGRLVRMSFFTFTGFRYPEYYGNETWLLFKAMQLGYNVKRFDDIRYEHIRKLGSNSQFFDYGPGMRCLGYHPLYVLARTFKNIIYGGAGIPRSAAIKILFDYINTRKWRNDPYFRYYDPQFRKFVREFQMHKLLFVTLGATKAAPHAVPSQVS